MNELDGLRKEIDQCDQELIEVFQRRMDLVTQVLAYKRKNNVPIFHPKREQEMIEKALLDLTRDDYAHEVKCFLEEILKISKELQHRLLED